MESLRHLYRIGPGPSSSHTLAIKRICEDFLAIHPDLKEYEIDLVSYGKELSIDDILKRMEE